MHILINVHILSKFILKPTYIHAVYIYSLNHKRKWNKITEYSHNLNFLKDEIFSEKKESYCHNIGPWEILCACLDSISCHFYLMICHWLFLVLFILLQDIILTTMLLMSYCVFFCLNFHLYRKVVPCKKCCTESKVVVIDHTCRWRKSLFRRMWSSVMTGCVHMDTLAFPHAALPHNALSCSAITYH